MPRYAPVKFSNDSEVIHFRPAVSALVTKLRELKILQDHPDNVEFVINDLIYHYLYREEKRPQAIFRVMMRNNALWRMALGVAEFDADERMIESASREIHVAEPTETELRAEHGDK